MLYICSDHGGFHLKKSLIEYLTTKDVQITDMGASSLDPQDDYPDFVIPTMKKVQDDLAGGAIVICKNGVGVSVLANKFKGIRAALSWRVDHASSSRADDNSNVLALPANYVDENMAKEIVDGWLNTNFSNEERHVRRIKKFEEAMSQ